MPLTQPLGTDRGYPLITNPLSSFSRSFLLQLHEDHKQSDLKYTEGKFLLKIFVSFISASIKRPSRVLMKALGIGSFPPSLRKFTSVGANGKKAINWLKWGLLAAAPPAIGLLYNYWDMVDNHLLRYEWLTSRKIIDKKLEVTADIEKR